MACSDELDVAAVGKIRQRILAAVPYQAGDHTALATSHHNAAAAWFGWARSAQRLVRSGKDSADLERIEVMSDVEWIVSATCGSSSPGVTAHLPIPLRHSRLPNAMFWSSRPTSGSPSDWLSLRGLTWSASARPSPTSHLQLPHDESQGMNRSTPHLTLSASDIAELAGVGRSTVSNWRARNDDFPKPIAGTTASPRFDAGQVRQWLEANGKPIHDLAADRVIWAAMDRWRGLDQPDRLASIASALIVWRHVSDPKSPGFEAELPQDARWPEFHRSDLVVQIERGVRAYSELRPERREAFATIDHAARWSHAFVQRPWALQEFVDALSRLDPASMCKAYISFQDLLTTSARRGYDVHATSSVLIDLIATAAAGIPGPVHDPAVGSGRLLFAVGDKGEKRTRLTGQEINTEVMAQVQQRALVTGREGVIVAHGDTLIEDRFEQGSAQVVVIDPPYSLKPASHQTFYIDPRYRFGTPPKANADLAWPEIAIWHLGLGGRAFVLLPAGAAFRGGAEGRIRAALLQERTVEAVVALPSGLAHHTTIPLSLWILARPGEAASLDSVLIIDQTGVKAPGINAIARALQTWRDEGSITDQLPMAAVPIDEILRADAVLTPARWLDHDVDAPSVDDVRAQLDAVGRTATEVASAAALVPSVVAPGHQRPHMVTLSDLEKAGRIRLLKSSERFRDDEFTTSGTPVITAAWIRGNEEAPYYVHADVLERPPLITEPGDVVLLTLSGPVARVDNEGGRILVRPDHVLIRMRDDGLSPQFLAAVLATARNRALNTGTAHQRVRAGDLQVPLLSRNEQDAVARKLSNIQAISRAAGDLARATAQAQATLVDAVTSGTVELA
ncbi:N-6 DNA methylase [Promicromonospora sukumoe]|uniref:N-6 DNA methylase n=1 Tax=Promicromonospora sukumoe TaxID=88382 RepID=UPI003646BA63